MGLLHEDAWPSWSRSSRTVRRAALHPGSARARRRASPAVSMVPPFVPGGLYRRSSADDTYGRNAAMASDWPGDSASPVEFATYFVATQAGGVERILHRHYPMPNGLCAGCLATPTEYPCLAARIAELARQRVEYQAPLPVPMDKVVPTLAASSERPQTPASHEQAATAANARPLLSGRRGTRTTPRGGRTPRRDHPPRTKADNAGATPESLIRSEDRLSRELLLGSRGRICGRITLPSRRWRAR